MIKIALATTAFLASTVALAQAQGVPNPFSGMGRDSDKPISIAADTTTADIRNETATYAGNVRIEQGNLHMRSDTLAIKASKGSIARIEAKGNVVLASPQGHATGAAAIYDVADRVVRMSGKVILAQGPNILRGSSLVINLATGRAELTSSGGAGGRVEGIFVPTKTPKGVSTGAVPPVPTMPSNESKPTP
ncbi:MAG: lipopolysaccharide transport periplasmic protein LptA [Alphaproteobacteria bacterium]|nr:lipopolysaccharide transport periplasmic protein LptA [Alphaproteobacteria bacterium]